MKKPREILLFKLGKTSVKEIVTFHSENCGLPLGPVTADGELSTALRIGL